ncbi:recombinational DNA repair ATPase RecF [Methylobacterium sp. OAE515]
MNAELIETRQQALDLLDADLITFGAYVALCRHKGWQA